MTAPWLPLFALLTSLLETLLVDLLSRPLHLTHLQTEHCQSTLTKTDKQAKTEENLPDCHLPVARAADLPSRHETAPGGLYLTEAGHDLGPVT